MRGVTDVNVSAGSGACYGLTKSYKWNARAAQVSHQGLTFGAVGMHRDINRIAMIESKAIMHFGLTECAHRKRTTEARKEKAFYFRSISKHPVRRAIVTDERGCCLIRSNTRRRHFGQLLGGAR